MALTVRDLTHWLPKRYVLGLMGLLAMATVYTMRSILSLAITAMVHPHHRPNTTFIHQEGDCPLPGNHSNQNDELQEDPKDLFDWDDQTQGWILAAFYYGYVITHVPGGMLAERYGGKWTLGAGVLTSTVFTLLTPAVAVYLGHWGMITIRVLSGIGEGITFPALSTLLAQWAPPLEKSKLTSMCFAGVQLGVIVANIVGGQIMEYGGWKSAFYVFGAMGLLWFALWTVTGYNDPASHPYISDEERQHLAKTIGSTQRDKELGVTPWRAILMSAPVWAVVICEFGHDWGLYTMTSYLPRFMKDVLHFDIAQNGRVSAMPYLAVWLCSLAAGALADWLLASEIMTFTMQRKIFSTIGAVGPGVGVILASYAGCEGFKVVCLFTIGMGLMGFCYSSLRVNALDLSPNYAGSIMAVVNGVGAVSGMLTPLLTGSLIHEENVKVGEWQMVFWIMFAVLFLTNLVFIIWGTANVQPWNDTKKRNSLVVTGFHEIELPNAVMNGKYTSNGESRKS